MTTQPNMQQASNKERNDPPDACQTLHVNQFTDGVLDPARRSTGQLKSADIRVLSK